MNDETVRSMRMGTWVHLAEKVPAGLVLFVLVFSAYWFTMSGTIQYGDETEKYRVAQSIVDRHEFSFRPTAQRNATGVGGRTFSIYELGQTLVEVPFYFLGRTVNSFFPQPDVNQIAQLFVGLLNPLVTALTAVLVYETCSILGFTAQISLALGLVFGLGTIAWPYSKGFTREPLLTFFLLLSFYCLYRFQKEERWAWSLAAGLAAGYLVFTKFILGAVLPFLVLYLLVCIYRDRMTRNHDSRRAILAALQALFLFLLPAIVFLSLQGLYALVRFGTPTSGIAGTRGDPIAWILMLVAASHPIQAIIGLLLSPQKSIFVYSPPILLGIIAWFRWRRVQPREAWLFMALVLIEWITVLLRPDWDGGTWWGPRYLVQITPLLIIPLGALETWPRVRRVYKPALVVFFTAGLLVQLGGASANWRDYMDATRAGITLAGQLDFLAHGALGSLFLYLSPAGMNATLNAFGILLLFVVLGFGILLAGRLRGDAAAPAALSRGRVGLAAVILVVEFVAFLGWVAAPYNQVLAAQGDTRLAAGNRFFVDGRMREAAAMYRMALDLGTRDMNQAVARLNDIEPPSKGIQVSASDLLAEVEMPDEAVVTRDTDVTLSGESLKISYPSDKDATVSALSDWIAVEPNANYELTGWMKAENIYGSGYGVVSWYEDNGSWKSPRKTDVTILDETSGWRPFRKRITTMPTTRRIMLSAGLWKTYGTIWVDGVELAEIPK